MPGTSLCKEEDQVDPGSTLLKEQQRREDTDPVQFLSPDHSQSLLSARNIHFL